MNKRPLPVTLIGWLFIVVGIIGIAYHAPEFKADNPFESELVLGLSVRLLAIVCGVFMLRGNDWARWLSLAWLLYHAILSVFHSIGQLGMHSLFLALAGYFLLRPQGKAYFNGREVLK